MAIFPRNVRSYLDCLSKIQTAFSLRNPGHVIAQSEIETRRPNGEKLHDRYLLTDIFSVMLGTGVDRAENPDSLETDDLTSIEPGLNNTLDRHRPSILSAIPSKSLVAVNDTVCGQGPQKFLFYNKIICFRGSQIDDECAQASAHTINHNRLSNYY